MECVWTVVTPPTCLSAQMKGCRVKRKKKKQKHPAGMELCVRPRDPPFCWVCGSRDPLVFGSFTVQSLRCCDDVCQKMFALLSRLIVTIQVPI